MGNLRLEIKLHARLNHPNIVRFYDCIQIGSKVYILLEYASNGCLYFYIDTQKGIPERLALRFLYEAAGALAYLHSQGVIHRDVKPENMLLDDTFNLKLCDFGWATRLQSENDVRNSICGTYQYMPPEVCFSTTHTFKADIWSLGILFYEMLHGRPPFEGDNLEAIKDSFENGRIEVDSSFSTDVRMLLRELLKMDSSLRPEAAQILRHPVLIRRAEELRKNLSQDEFFLMINNFLRNTGNGKNMEMTELAGALVQSSKDLRESALKPVHARSDLPENFFADVRPDPASFQNLPPTDFFSDVANEATKSPLKAEGFFDEFAVDHFTFPEPPALQASSGRVIDSTGSSSSLAPPQLEASIPPPPKLTSSIPPPPKLTPSVPPPTKMTPSNPTHSDPAHVFRAPVEQAASTNDDIFAHQSFLKHPNTFEKQYFSAASRLTEPVREERIESRFPTLPLRAPTDPRSSRPANETHIQSGVERRGSGTSGAIFEDFVPGSARPSGSRASENDSASKVEYGLEQRPRPSEPIAYSSTSKPHSSDIKVLRQGGQITGVNFVNAGYKGLEKGGKIESHVSSGQKSEPPKFKYVVMNGLLVKRPWDETNVSFPLPAIPKSFSTGQVFPTRPEPRATFTVPQALTGESTRQVEININVHKLLSQPDRSDEPSRAKPSQTPNVVFQSHNFGSLLAPSKTPVFSSSNFAKTKGNP